VREVRKENLWIEYKMPIRRRPRRILRRAKAALRRIRRRKFGPSLGKGGFTVNRKAIPSLVQCTAAGAIESINTSGGASTSFLLGAPSEAYESTSLNRVYDVPFAMLFKLDEVFAYNDFTSIADRYRIANVQIKIHGYNVAQVNGAVNYAPNMFIEYVTDWDDATVPSIQQFSEKMGTHTKGFNQQGYLTLNIKPRVPMMTGENNVSIPSRSVFVDMAAPGQEHYGIKGILRNVSLYDVKSLGLKVHKIYTIVVKDLQ